MPFRLTGEMHPQNFLQDLFTFPTECLHKITYHTIVSSTQSPKCVVVTVLDACKPYHLAGKKDVWSLKRAVADWMGKSLLRLERGHDWYMFNFLTAPPGKP